MGVVTIRAAVLGLALIGGWWASRAAATSVDARPERPAIAGPSDDAFQKLLQEVRRRTVELDQRERELGQRAIALESLEEAVAQSLGDLQGAEPATSAAGCRLRGGVTRIYESMRPEEAAQILDQLDDETLRVVFARMDPKQIASIMAAMSRERAVAFTKTLAADPALAGAAR